jgi:hypothetical protein|tara:strand:- start:231 stop:416 length:186 start_codon:yes stop_codon:yes gene_type:complete
MINKQIRTLTQEFPLLFSWVLGGGVNADVGCVGPFFVFTLGVLLWYVGITATINPQVFRTS